MGAKYPPSISLPSSNGGRDVETEGTKFGFVVGLEDITGVKFTP